ncbi:uncharacterized protein LOC113240206 [Hyposmocoma kahamanoa]|uniref:uncharacterized protein LOC113240206 n=1 Tax=Hyposmocoma kahamanoa TaxID=1477025 RepID=UPI000E6D9600|nr:uncharacterized protein LOC113240206 [Hyposmocoma kahamanoa]
MDQKPKKFPILVFIHGDSFEWSSGNPYDGRILASYGNIMVITVNFRLGILGFMKPSLTEHVYGNNGLLDQLAALQWIKDNIEDLNGDPRSVTLMGHGTGAACVNYLMMSPISNGLFHRAILMSGSALSDWAMTKDPTQFTMQVAQISGCNPSSKNMMSCLQNKPLSEIKRVQILARDFETPLAPIVAGSFIPNEPAKIMESFPNLLSKYQVLSGVTEYERYHDFGVIELDHGVLENQRDEFIKNYAKVVFGVIDDVILKEILKQYAPSKLDPQRWSVEANRDVILNVFSDSRTLAPMIRFANYQSKSNRQSYFYVFGHNSISTDYAGLNKSVNGEELPYVFGVPLGGAYTHFHSDYTQKEKLLSEVIMRLWTNFIKMGTPNTQSVNEYYTLDEKQWKAYNVDWPEYDVNHQSYLRLDIPPLISSLYRSNYTKFWIEELPTTMKKYVIDPLYDYTPTSLRSKITHGSTSRPESPRKPYQSRGSSSSFNQPYQPRYVPSVSSYGSVNSYPSSVRRLDTDKIYREISQIDKPSARPPAPNGLMENSRTTTTTHRPSPVVKTSGATITLVISLGILFLAVNVAICAILYFKKRNLRLREQAFVGARHSRAEIGEVDVIGQKLSKDDKSALKTFKNGYSAIKTMSISKIRGNSKKGSSKSKKKLEPCKTPKSDDSGGFRERFQLRRHLSTSTLDANTKVKDWITNELMHRCSPNILMKSNTDLQTEKRLTIAKPFTRSEELLSDTTKSNKGIKDTLVVGDARATTLPSKASNKPKTSEKTTSTSALGSHSSIASNKQSVVSKQTGKSNESLKSKGTDSTKSQKVSVAIDATPAARTNSILSQVPIEISKSFDCNEPKHSNEDKLQKSKTESDTNVAIEMKPDNHEKQKFTNEVTLSLGTTTGLKISHKHSTSDPVTDINYEKIIQEKIENGESIINILPPVTFRNDINVTSRDEKRDKLLTAAEALLTIQRRNYPKVLPDLPKAQKRLSLQPTAFQTFRNYVGGGECQVERSKVPPQPPPRTTTLERRLAYKNTKTLSSFDTANVKKISKADTTPRNYENVDTLSPPTEFYRSINKCLERSPSINNQVDPVIVIPKEREYPKVIIASSNIPSIRTPEPKLVIQSSPSQVEIPSNAPRVRLPDDFHSHSQTGSLTSFSSFCSEDDDDDDDDDIDDEFLDEVAENQLIKELVGGVESPTGIDQLDSKGPETIFEKKLEIVPVKINPGYLAPKNKEDYVCISNLHLPDVSDFEKTAQIKPTFGLNKLQQRSESIHSPMEMAVKVKQKRKKPSTILNNSLKGKRKSDKCKSDSSKLEHSTSGSSNDTETSTGTVRQVLVKK